MPIPREPKPGKGPIAWFFKKFKSDVVGERLGQHEDVVGIGTDDQLLDDLAGLLEAAVGTRLLRTMLNTDPGRNLKYYIMLYTQKQRCDLQNIMKFVNRLVIN